MKLCFSNIAWSADADMRVYAHLQLLGFTALEIAPTRLFPDDPYAHAEAFAAFSRQLRRRFGLSPVSAQSILNGRQENLFEPLGAEALLSHLSRCAAFCAAGGVENLVFGCPKNRQMPPDGTEADALSFFRRAAEIARRAGCRLALEANLPVYGTNFINTTEQAFRFTRRCEGLFVNLDVGTMLGAGESLALLEENLPLVSHIHVSEVGLAPIQRRELHRDLAALLRRKNYRFAVSVEMKNEGEQAAMDAAAYLAEVFRNVAV